MKSTLEDTTLRISFDGDLLSTNVHDLRPKLFQALEANPDATTLHADLKNCKVIDSMGLNLLIALYRECEKRKISFKAINVSPEVKRLFGFLNLTSRFGVE
ncbi:MAG: STAS domain-containing protein [Chthoniobacterales bacterium]|nr:STAS domain-containing protein [Chthoniobacterales bacterium]MCX7713484.1 STAS domain-containing protein [Chthoniobacterales bacterium]